MFPTNMVALLLLWDELGIPHEEWKQVFRSPLPIIGFDMDPNLMKISLKEESKRALVQELRDFVKYKRCHSLQEFEHIVGSLNWALNVCPLLHPGLSAVYTKIQGKTNPKGLLWLNQTVVEEILWAAFLLTCLDRVYLLCSVSWEFQSLSDTLQVFCDASGMGIGYWYPSLNLGFQSNLPAQSPVNDIFFYKALCVASAIHDAVTRLLCNGHLAIFTDSLNSVYMFNLLSGGLGFNCLLMNMVEVILVLEVDFRVFHISGEHNIVVDHISHWWASEVA
jgi:hypothetical protein